MANQDVPDGGGTKVANQRERPFFVRPFFLLTILVVQNSAAALTGRYTRSGRPKDELFNIGNFLLVCEVAKLILSLLLEAIDGNLLSKLRTHVWQRPKETLQLAPPALLFFASNTFRYVAQGNLQVPVFQVIVQSRLITTAWWSVLLLQRSYVRKQWICLVTTTLGLVIVVLGEAKGRQTQPQNKYENLSIGVPSLLGACFLSSLASVYLEKVYKANPRIVPLLGENDGQAGPAPPTLWMRNIQLACFSIVIATLQNIGTYDHSKPFFYGFHPLVWLQVALFSGGGVLVAAVTKYADSVLKGLATAISMLVSSVLSAVLLSAPIRSGSFVIGATTIIASVYLFSNAWPSFCKKRYLFLFPVILVHIFVFKAESDSLNSLLKDIHV